MSKVKTFNELWEQCEQFHKEAGNNVSASIITELLLKIKFYTAIDSKELPMDDKQKIKSRLLGEILLNITNISLIDNINVYKALEEALQFRSIETSLN